MRLTIVQHGHKEAGPGHPGLSRLGREQASRTAGYLAAAGPPAVLLSSPQRRARETAAELAVRLGLPVALEPRLRERLNWEGPPDQSLEAFLAEWERTTADRDLVPTSGDSSRAAGRRFLDLVDELAHAHGDDRVVAVGHGGVTVDLLRTVLTSEAVTTTWPDLVRDGVPPGALTELVATSGRIAVTEVASTAHLADPAPAG